MMRVLSLFALIVLIAGCSPSESATSTTAETTPVVFNAAGAPTVEFSVPDMMCEESCAPKVKEILSKQAGVKEVLVNFPHRTATVALKDEGAFDSDHAIAQLVDYGFGASSVKKPAPAKPSG